jgi:hypothetical protein
MSGSHRWWIDMKTVEYWMWRYRNVETGRFCRTMFPCSAEEASRLYPVGTLDSEGEWLYRQALALQLEGIVAKRLDSQYFPAFAHPTG